MQSTDDQDRHRAAAEVLELGETLFDSLIEAARARPEPDAASDPPFPVEEVQAAAAEFFVTLRLLLRVPEA
jgi:hypothetical protein